jgi:ATP-dependent Clp protease ATP-binding subunit ClpB
MNFEKFTTKAAQAVDQARQIALEFQNNTIDVLHLFLALCTQQDGYGPLILKKLGIDLAAVQQSLKLKMGALPRIQGAHQMGVSQQSNEVLTQAMSIAQQMQDQYLSTEHLLLALLKVPSDLQALVFSPYAVTYEKMMQVILEIRGGERVTSQDPEVSLDVLEKYGRNLTQDAREGKIDPIIGREDEIRRTMQILSRRMKNNPVLVGDPGVGKTAIIEGLALKIVKDQVPDTLKDKTIFELDMGSLTA